MELLRYRYKDSYSIQASSTDIAMSWRKFKVRARRLQPEMYCDYSFGSGGELDIYNLEIQNLEEVDEILWHTARPVFFEDHRYNITLTFFNAVEEPRIIHPNKEVEDMFSCVQTSSGEYILSTSIDFLNQPGHFALKFEYKTTEGKHLQEIGFDVLSPKLDTKDDLNVIIHQIREEYGDLVFRYLTLTFQQFEIGKEANNELIWLSVFKQIVDKYVQAVRFVIHKPHNKMQQIEEYKKADRIKTWTPQLIDRYTNDSKADSDKALRQYYRTERTEATLDTRENRFVKYTLECIGERLSRLLDRMKEDTSDNEIANLQEKQRELQALRMNTFFRGIGRFDGFRQQSMVMQQRSGYSQVYRYWIMLQNGLDLIHGETSVGVQPIWKLYELWCFLRVKQLVCKVLGIDPHNKEHIQQYIHENTHNAFDLFNGGSLSGCITYTNPKNGDEVEVGYQYSFSRAATGNGNNANKYDMRSATTEQMPDIIIHIHKKEQDITLTYLYDAKYRVKGDGDEQVRNVIDEPVSETLDAMHHYRDAIYYGKRGEKRFSKEIIGGYILFPGRMDEQDMLDKLKRGEKGVPYFLQSIEEVNIGAYPLLPNEESGLLLEDHLRKVLLEETVVEQIEDSVPQRGLHYTRKDVSDKLVYVGYVKPENAEYELFKRNEAKNYYTGSLDFDELDIQSLEYLLPIVAGNVQGVYEIESIGFKKLSKIRPLRRDEKDGLRVVFTLGDFVEVLDKAVSYQKRLHNHEVMSLEEVKERLSEIKSLGVHE